MKNFILILGCLLLVVLSGCSSSNNDALQPGDKAHPANWIILHGGEANTDLRGCQGCHGFDFKGSEDAVSCFECHSSGPPFVGAHPASWNADPLTSHRLNFQSALSDQTPWTTCAIAACHGTKLQGGTAGPTCQNATDCHTTGTNGWPPAPLTHVAYSNPSNHGPAAKGKTDPALNMGNNCILCHGTPTNNFNGGFVFDAAIMNVAGTNCSAAACHPDARAHPADWIPANNVIFHSDGSLTTKTKTQGCALCHNISAAIPAGPMPAAPSCFAANFQTQACHASGPGIAPHAVPFTDPNLHGPAAKADLVYCQGCHGTTGSAATFGAAGSNPTFDVRKGSLTTGCESASCHAAGTAHPTGTDRWTFNLAGATRRTHFASANVTTACAMCHDINDTGTGPGNAAPCINCHVSMASYSLDCTACHGTPPTTGTDLTGGTVVNHLNVSTGQAGTLHDTCALCHGAKDSGAGVIVANSGYALFNAASATLKQGGDHLDGTIKMNGPVGVGAGYNATTFTCTQTCHATEVGHALSDSGLIVEYANYGAGSCDACHGYPPNGSGGSTNHLQINRVNGTGTNVSDAAFFSAHGQCDTCHGLSGTPAYPATASNFGSTVDNTGNGGDAYILATMHNKGSVQMNGDRLPLINEDAGYDAAQQGCTKACHVAPAVNYRFTTVKANTVALLELGSGDCTACHFAGAAIGPFPPVTQAHPKHTAGTVGNYLYGCKTCHPQDHNGSVDVTFNGLNNIPAGGSFNAVAKTCSTTYCHGGATPNWTGGPAQAACGSCHGAATTGRPTSPPSGGSHQTASHAAEACTSCHTHNGDDTAEHAAGPQNANSAALVSSAAVKVTAFTYGGSLLGTDVDGFRYSAGSCTATCHSASTWGSTGACSTCHDTGTGGAPIVNSASAHVITSTGGSFNQCEDCHSGHVGSGGVTIPLPPIAWSATAGETHVTGNMRTALGINYATHNGINIGGPGTVASINAKTTEAEVCWGCHDSLATKVSEWGYNTDMDGATFPAVKFTDRDGTTANSYNYGTLHTGKPTTATANTTSNWVASGAWYRNGYLSDQDRPIASVHAVSFTTADHSSSVANNIVAGRVKRDAANSALPGAALNQGSTTAPTLEPVTALRCSYCHDVHNTFGPSGKPYLRGTWLNNPYPADMSPQSGTSYATTQHVFSRTNNGTPRPTINSRSKGGYWIDQNSANVSGTAYTAPTVSWNTSGVPAYTATTDVATTAGLCIVCHGGTGATGASGTAQINSMDYYTGSSMWRTPNGHNYAALGGTKDAAAANDDLFDARRTTTTNYYLYMGNQYYVGSYNQPGPSWQTNMPLRRTGSSSSVYVSGWWTRGKSVRAVDTSLDTNSNYDFSTWYAANAVPPKFHYFTCSKCHSPHATGLPALLITNCLDKTMATWSAGSANPSVSQSTNCHRKESTTTGWNTLQPAQ